MARQGGFLFLSSCWRRGHPRRTSSFTTLPNLFFPFQGGVSPSHLFSTNQKQDENRENRDEGEGGGGVVCTRSWKGKLLPLRPEKFLGDYTSLTRSRIISMWRRGQISLNGFTGGNIEEEIEREEDVEQEEGESIVDETLGEEEEEVAQREDESDREEQKGGGKFMSDLLIMDGDDVKVNNYNIFPCSAPLHPQFGVLDEETSSLSWDRKNPIIPTICLGFHKPPGIELNRTQRSSEREMNALGQLMRQYSEQEKDGRFPAGLLHSLLYQRLGINSLPYSLPEVPEWLKEPRSKLSWKDFFALAGLAGFFPIGRLDKDTSGLILFTNDGDFATAITNPGLLHREYRCSFRYRERGNHSYDENDSRLHLLRSGVVLPDGLIQPVSVTFVPPKIKKEEKRRKEGRQLTEEEDFYSQMTKMKAGENKSKRKEKKSGGKWDVDIVIDEGRNRVVRKMVSKVKLGHLDSLKRLRFGPVSLQSLGVQKETWKQIPHEVVEEMWETAGGRERVRDAKIKALMIHSQHLQSIGRPNPSLEEWLASLNE